MRTRIARYRRIPASPAEDYEIGCILLQSPFFFPEEFWIPASDWSPNIVQGRTYDTSEPHDKSLWQQVEEHLRLVAVDSMPELMIAENSQRVGLPQIVFPRLGQGSFRVLVADAYKRRCVFTDSPVLHVLDAAHIRPFMQEGPHDIRNGILLRQDVHTLFDRGYITVTPEHRIEVSHLIKEEFENGHEYYSAHGRQIRLPQDSEQWPAKNFLGWHNEHVYLG